MWIHAQQDSLGNGQQSIDQVRQSLARWTADNGGYDATFQAVHNTSMQGSDRDHAADQMGNGRSVQDYRWNEAHSERAWHEYGTLLHNLTGDTPDGDQIRRIQDKIGGGASYQSARTELAYSSVGRQATDKIFESLGIGKPDDRQYGVFKSWFAQGKSLAEIRTMAAQGYEGVQAVNTLYQTVLGRVADSGGLKTYQDQLAAGRNLAEVRQEIVGSPEADTHIRIFLTRDVGQITDELIADSRTTLNYVAQAYQTLKSETSENLYNLANSYRNSYNNGTLLQSIMPHTWGDWLNLTATVMLFTPLGPEEVAAGRVIIGGEKLLSAVLNVEERAAALSLESRGVAAVLPESATGALDELATFLPKQEGRTLVLDENTTVTQFAKPEGPNVLHFFGSNDQAVKSYFEKITGADKNPGALGHRDLPDGKEVWFIKTAKGEFRLRSKSSSSAKGGLDKWTIDLPRGLLNPAKLWLMEIKFY